MTSYQVRVLKREWDPLRKEKRAYTIITAPLTEQEAFALAEQLRSKKKQVNRNA
ncbi:MAG: hypothetical protein JRN10_00270 [Nitrososphaerota archaeon]|jgi:hypothetical protein|nr:hypothetical protein [Nitrososphaerota archaeon]MDG6929672.1 hypothetical protein [Nitrososphaerota archaeon]